MKRNLTLLLSILIAGLHAQPVATSANDPTPGSTFHYNYVDSSTAQPGGSGANQTWNFSGLVPNGLIHTDEWLLPASTPYAANFPGTNLVQMTTDTGGNTIYLYHNATTAMTELKGMGFSFSGTPYISTYSDPQIIRQYPATFNSALSDNFFASAMITQGPVTINFYRYGNYSYLVDGYGSLITPVGSYPNTLRVKINQEMTDSMVYAGIPLPAQIIQHYSTTYFWISTDAGDKLYQFYIGYDTSITSSSTIITKSVSYHNTITGIEDPSSYETSKAFSYPNPGLDYTTIIINNPVNGEAELSLYDLKGRLVKNIFSNMITTGQRYKWRLSISDLPTGLYQARITCGNKQWLSKIEKLN